jgi:hypothetical protein
MRKRRSMNEYVRNKLLQDLEAPKVCLDEPLDDVVQHLIDGSQAPLRRCGPEGRELGYEASLGFVRDIVGKFPSDGL